MTTVEVITAPGAASTCARGGAPGVQAAPHGRDLNHLRSPRTAGSCRVRARPRLRAASLAQRVYYLLSSPTRRSPWENKMQAPRPRDEQAQPTWRAGAAHRPRARRGSGAVRPSPSAAVGRCERHRAEDPRAGQITGTLGHGARTPPCLAGIRGLHRGEPGRLVTSPKCTQRGDVLARQSFNGDVQSDVQSAASGRRRSRSCLRWVVLSADHAADPAG